MKLKNNSGNEREVSVLFETYHKKKKYVVYEDKKTNKIYGGRFIKNKIKPLEDDEVVFLNKMLEKMEGVNL